MIASNSKQFFSQIANAEIKVLNQFGIAASNDKEKEAMLIALLHSLLNEYPELMQEAAHHFCNELQEV